MVNKVQSCKSVTFSLFSGTLYNCSSSTVHKIHTNCTFKKWTASQLSWDQHHGQHTNRSTWLQSGAAAYSYNITAEPQHQENCVTHLPLTKTKSLIWCSQHFNRNKLLSCCCSIRGSAGHITSFCLYMHFFFICVCAYLTSITAQFMITKTKWYLHTHRMIEEQDLNK